VTMSRIVVDENYCKGCALCVEACPRHIIALDPGTITAKGYHPAMLTDESACTACENCALMCPDVAITVEKG
jgi:2-oxoglutarate ferredoxin oxidoreductase subunit delta